MIVSGTFAPDSFTSFGSLLLYLRRRAQLRQRDLAVVVGYSEAQIGRLEKEQRLPDPAIVMARFVPALDLDDEPGFAARLVQLARDARDEDANETRPPSATLPSSAAPIPERNVAVELLDRSTPFVGRTAELAALQRLLTAPEARCVTLLGPGGAGKTRLAVEAVGDLESHFDDGLYIIALAEVQAPHMLAPAMAQALRLPDHAGDAERLLQAYLAQKRCLLLLDNAEHLVAGAGVLAALLAAAPLLRLLVTSRERLHIRNEQILEIAGLPAPDRNARAERLAANDAVALFVAGARRRQPDWTPVRDDMAAIARICALVEGLPLALELAAAWSSVLSCAEIEAELRRSLDFLASRDRDAPERHRSLRAAFDYSWRLLSAAEQRALSRLSSMYGSFGREAAVSLLGDARNGASMPRALEVLAALSDKSMLRRSTAAGESRFALHELVRQYANEHLAADSAEHDDARERHARFYNNLMARADTALRGPEQFATLERLDLDGPNVRAALRYAAQQADVATLRDVLPVLLVYGAWRLPVQDAELLLDTLAELLRRTQPPAGLESAHRAVLALASSYAGALTFMRAPSDEAIQRLRAARDLAADCGDALVLGDTLLALGTRLADFGDPGGSIQMLRAAIAEHERAGDQWRVTRALLSFGAPLLQLGEYIAAQRILLEAARRCKAIGDPRETMWAMNQLGHVSALLGRHSEAKDYLQQSLLLASTMRDQHSGALALYEMGQVALENGDYTTAAYMFDETLHTFRELGDQTSAAHTLAQLGYGAALAGDAGAAQAALDQGLATMRGSGDSPITLDLLVGRAALDLLRGAEERATEALATVLYHPRSSQMARDRAARLLREAEARLTPYAFAAARSRAGTLPPSTLLERDTSAEGAAR